MTKPRPSPSRRNNPIDPGVAEVRRWRAGLWKRGGGTLKGVMRLLRENQAAGESTGDVDVVRTGPRRGGKKRGRAA